MSDAKNETGDAEKYGFDKVNISKTSYLRPEGGRLTDREQGANDVILTGLDAHAPEGAVKRRLKARHISMVSSLCFYNLNG